jgi:hypothetical protein
MVDAVTAVTEKKLGHRSVTVSGTIIVDYNGALTAHVVLGEAEVMEQRIPVCIEKIAFILS